MNWRPSAGVGIARERAAMKQRIRHYFDSSGSLEVDTPMLSPAAVSDPNIHSLCVQRPAFADRDLYLHTSPEFAMKRLLAAGYPDIHYLGTVFRDGELGRRHQPEFTMLEWYRLGADEDAIIDDTVQLIRAALQRDIEVEAMHYATAFENALGIDPLSASADELRTAAGAPPELAESLGGDRDGWLDWLFVDRIAPTFREHTLTVIQRYPASQAALARLAPDEPRTALRFEVFAGSLELANGYVELGDADELAARFAADLEQRRAQGRPRRPLDQRFLDAMRAGLPACSGVALGFDRLLMLHLGKHNIRDVISFEFEG